MVHQNHKSLDVGIIGPGMIVHDLILPAVYHLQRNGWVGDVTVCGTRPASLLALKNNSEIKEAFPGQDFKAMPDPAAEKETQPELYKELLKKLDPFQVVIVALPDQLHFRVVMDALEADQHVLCVKPLVLSFAEAAEIERKARERGLMVVIEYHKRFDRRALIARRRCQAGELGDFVMGEAKMIEPYYYRSSNFQNWFTTEYTDPFVYVGCHYVDLVGFITGLRPVEVSSAGVEGIFPNGRKGYMWAVGRVRFENGALLTVTDGLGYPDEGAGANEQCLTMFFEGAGRSAVLKHNDQFRGVEYAYLEPKSAAAKRFYYVNPDFFQYIPWEGQGFKPAGYGVDSVCSALKTMSRIEARASAEKDPLAIRRTACQEVNQKGLIATPANSWTNELVHEAARLSIQRNGAVVDIVYEPKPGVRLKDV
jgi:predicted dehydrogenase